MTQLIWTNNAQTTLGAPLTNVALSCTLTTGAGALFPSPSAGQGFTLTFKDAATGLLREIVLCTARSGDVCTIVRAQEGTTALPWLAGDLAGNLVTAGGLNSFKQPATARTRLTANTTWYVATTGNNVTGDGTIGLPWQTIQFAIDYIYNNIDPASYTVTIQVADGTYTNTVLVVGYLPNIAGLVISGNITTPANCIISTSNSNGSVEVVSGRLAIGGFKILNSAGPGVNASLQGNLSISGKMDFGACATAHILANDTGSEVQVSSNYTISGSSPYHFSASAGANITLTAPITITLTGTPSFSNQFAFSQKTGVLTAFNAAFSGAATGVRYTTTLNGVIDTGGGGANFFPGNAAGSTATGGQYA